MSASSLRKANAEPLWLRLTLTGIALGFLFFFLALPLLAVFFEAFRTDRTAASDIDGFTLLSC